MVRIFTQAIYHLPSICLINVLLLDPITDPPAEAEKGDAGGDEEKPDPKSALRKRTSVVCVPLDDCTALSRMHVIRTPVDVRRRNAHEGPAGIR